MNYTPGEYHDLIDYEELILELYKPELRAKFWLQLEQKHREFLERYFLWRDKIPLKDWNFFLKHRILPGKYELKKISLRDKKLATEINSIARKWLFSLLHHHPVPPPRKLRKPPPNQLNLPL